MVTYYGTLELPADFVTLMSEHIEAAVQDEQASLRALSEQLVKRLRAMDEKEERLLDLAADGELPQTKIRTRLGQLYLERQRLTAEQQRSGEELAAGAAVISRAIELLQDIPRAYANAEDGVRGLLNDALFKRLWVDDEGVVDSLMQDPFREIAEAATMHRHSQEPPNEAAPRFTPSQRMAQTKALHIA